MEIRTILKQGFLLLCSFFTLQLNAASIGTFAFADNAIADQLISSQGQVYNGSSWYFATGSSWQFNNGTEWQTSTAPTDTTDKSVSSYLAVLNSTSSAQFEYGFSQISVVNGIGSDLAFFFLWDQSNNIATVSINGISQNLAFANVFNDQGIQQLANGVIWDDSALSNVQMVAGVVDLSNFGLLQDERLNSSISIELQSNNEADPIALSLIAALHSSDGAITPVPLPAAFFLFLSGLSALGFFIQRNKDR